MKNLKVADSTYLLEEGLEKLHQESMDWISEMDLWKLELDFFQKLLDKYSAQFSTIEQKKRLDYFQNLIIYYSGELIDSFIEKTKRHETLLAKEMVEPLEMDEQEYRKMHKEIEEDVRSLRKRFYAYKKEFLTFIKPVI